MLPAFSRAGVDLDPGETAVQDGALVVRQESEAGPGIGFELGRGEGGGVPDKAGGVVDPDVTEVLVIAGCFLEPAKEDDVLLVVGQAVTRPGWGGFPFRLDAGPLFGRAVELPEVGVVVEGSLLGGGELAAEEVDGLGVVAAAAPGVGGPGEGGVGGGDGAPLVLVDVVDVELVEEAGAGAVVELAAEEEQLVGVDGVGEEGGVAADGGWGVEDCLGDSVVLLLLQAHLLEDGIEIDVVVRVDVAVVFGRLGL